MTADELERLTALAAKLTEALSDAVVCANEMFVLSSSALASRASPEVGSGFGNTVHDRSRPYVDASRFSVYWGGRVCSLRHTILFRLAECLVQQLNRFVSNDKLLRDVWNDGVKAPDTVRSAVRRLRERFDDAGMHDLAAAIHAAGGGYGLILPA
jgi:DNA-binding response OmpR family regulator